MTDGGTINGHVRVVGDIAPLPPQPVFKEKDYCGETVVDERLVTDPAGGVAGSVVHLVDVAAGKPIARSDTIRLDNRKCAFDTDTWRAAKRGPEPEMHDCARSCTTRTRGRVTDDPPFILALSQGPRRYVTR